MKARKIKKIRKLFSDKKWVQDKLEYWLGRSEDNNTFLKFECSSFFVGYEKAKYNRAIYKKTDKLCDRKIRMFTNLLKQITK